MRWFRLFVLTIVSVVGAYLLAAATLAQLPVNDAWRRPDGGVTIYVATNGVHTGVVLPVRAEGVDWRAVVRPGDVRGPVADGDWLLIGWGDRRFYLETPTWKELRPSVAVAALAGSGETLLHVDHWRPFVPDETIRPLRLRPDEYRRLAREVAATLAPEREVIRGYGPDDVFYAARGRYSLFATCNVWTARMLAAAGVRIGRWTPFEWQVMRWVRRAR